MTVVRIISDFHRAASGITHARMLSDVSDPSSGSRIRLNMIYLVVGVPLLPGGPADPTI